MALNEWDSVLRGKKIKWPYESIPPPEKYREYFIYEIQGNLT
jgi:hypothetical protein